MTGKWVEPDIRDDVVLYVETLSQKTSLSKRWLIARIGISPSKYYQWQMRSGLCNRHSGQVPKCHWLLPWEINAIVQYCQDKHTLGYRVLTYMMLDENIVAASPASVYRVLKKAGFFERWQPTGKTKKQGFTQPLAPHEHWHVDIAYVKIQQVFYFLIFVIDGFSRYCVHHELRAQMQESDIEITIQRALEKFPGVSPRIISDRGGQFKSKEFKQFINQVSCTHIMTSVAHPQSNGKAERFVRTVRGESIRQQSYLDLFDGRKQIAAYIDYYNTKRLHSAIYYLTPEDVLLGRMDERLKERQLKLDQAREERINAWKQMEKDAQSKNGIILPNETVACN